MRFHLGAVPEDFEPDETWRTIREPGPLLMQVIALPVAVVTGTIVLIAWNVLAGPLSLQLGADSAPIAFAFALLSFPAVIIVHELIHAAVHPRWGLSRASVIGAWPSKLLFYAHYSGPLSRDRFLAVFIAPFVAITLVPLLLASVGLIPQGNIRSAVAWLSVLNALSACGDLLGVGLILFQIPRRAIVQNKGWRTYWRAKETDDARVVSSLAG